ncbi:YybS family protein [Bacillus sp. H-16]|uniref:YybS family protein n=1 Tax=Alteribacter salitolerans TaxID=2912333 RepID=UPI0019633082|nr:YybS family protein [Alteribacter salitolerans]MBM7095385.1 YybS family protein [Alteribacter salitolerans]
MMNETSPIKEGALYIGIYLLLIMATLFVPVISLFTMFLLPVPFIIFAAKHGLRPAIFLMTVSFAVLLIIAYPLAIIFTITFASTGVVIGELYRRKKTAFGVLLGGSLTFIAAIILNFIGSIVILDVHPIESVQDVLYESVETTESLLPMLGQDDTFETAAGFIDGLTTVTPALFIILGISYAFTVQWIASFILRKRKVDVTRFPPLREWGFPKSFIWYYLIMYIFIYFVDMEEGSALYMAMYNLLPILELIMVIQGLACIFFFFHVKKIHKAVPVAILFLGILFPPLLYLIRILGIIDLVFDLRKRMDTNR